MRRALKAVGIVVAIGCGAPKPPALAVRGAADGLLIGEMALAHARPVVDGDTIHVQGLDASLRLLAIDTEETFKHEAERRAYQAGWEGYLRDQRHGSPRPVKMATPLGDEAKIFAERFFAGVAEVRLERDHPGEVRDYYDRYLAYVFVASGGRWVNYNVECVRAGYSPYFTKYGYSRRFHEEFVAAENQARAARRGIWDPGKQHYPDYEERKRWWDGRAEIIRAFETEAAGREDFVQLTRQDALDRLDRLVGKEVTLLGSVAEIRHGEHGPTIVRLSRRRGDDFPLVFFDEETLAASRIVERAGEYVRVRGVVSRHDDQRRGRSQLEIRIDRPGQILP